MPALLRPMGSQTRKKHAYVQVAAFYKNVYYAFFIGPRPQTITALADSPVGLATFMIDHDARSLELIARSFDGVFEGLTPDDILDNVTPFWVTNTGVSAARLYWENKLAFFTPKGVKLPVVASAFPDELFQAPRSWTERAYRMKKQRKHYTLEEIVAILAAFAGQGAHLEALR